MNPDLAMLPPERALPPERFAAARGQLESVVTTRLRPFPSRWRLGVVFGLGVGLTVGGGVGPMVCFPIHYPGLRRNATGRHGLGHAHRNGNRRTRAASAQPRSVSLILTGLSVGTYRFPNGSTMGCAKSDLASRPFGCQTMAVEPLVAGQPASPSRPA